MNTHNLLPNHTLKRRQRIDGERDHRAAGRAMIRVSAALVLATCAIAGCGGSSAPGTSSTPASVSTNTLASVTSTASPSGHATAPAAIKTCQREVHPTGDPVGYHDKLKACLQQHGYSTP